ncbi:MAG: CRISPR-associated endonuclease Cas1 [Saprospiraceae bacterium]|nr:CRISPR-associated endonuclease Cas1 [Saprospiraceae bacterium]
MNIFIDSYGVYIDVKDSQFQMKDDENVRQISPYKVTSINLLKPCAITTPAILLAAEFEIPVLIYDQTARVQAWCWSHQYGTIADIRIRQAYYCRSDARLDWIQLLLNKKAEGQISNLTWIKNRVPRLKNTIDTAIGGIQNQMIIIKDMKNISRMRSAEAHCAKMYWDVIFQAFTQHTDAQKRTKYGAQDNMNMSLNYCYGIMYGIIEASLLMKGVDPYIGLLHINRHDKAVLTFDHIEPFRPWIDRMVIEMFVRGFGQGDNFEEDDTGQLKISTDGRKALITAFFDMMEQRSYLNGLRIKRKDHVHHLSAQLVDKLKKFEIP